MYISFARVLFARVIIIMNVGTPARGLQNIQLYIMKELKCPKCGNVFSVDEADYALLLNQVKNAEFETELNRRLAEVQQTWESRQQAQALQAANDNQKMLFEKDAQLQKKEAEIQTLKLQMAKADADKKVELQSALQTKDSLIQQLQNANVMAARQAELDKKSLRRQASSESLSYLMNCSSTRRFICLPSTVSLSEIGRVAP